MPEPLGLRLLVLSLLAIKPSHGYELSKAISRLTMGAVRAGPGSLYPLLHELAREGLVEEEATITGGRLRKTYRLTEKGRAALAQALQAARAICESVATVFQAAEQALHQPPQPPGCVPRRVIEALRALEETVKGIRESLEPRACPRGGGGGA